MGDHRPLSSFTSGDFDFPPATSSNNDTSSAVAASLERLRRGLERTREQARSADEAAAAGRNAAWATSSLSRRRRTRDSDSANPASLLGQPLTTGNSSEADEGRRRGAKRIKLHHSEPEAAFTYGHFGQVEAGRLRLDLESCDGDVYRHEGRINYGPENILKHDKSVYCTRASKCNIILRHHDSSPFTLEKLYILAPENGFTAPLREGLVYVAMDRESLLPHLESKPQQPSRFASPRRSPSRQHRDRNNVRLSFIESLHDSEVSRGVSQQQARDWSPFGSSVDRDTASPEDEHVDDPWATTQHAAWLPLDPVGVSRHPARHASDLSACDEQTQPACDDDTQGIALTDDEINWPEDPSTAAVLADRQRRERNMAIDDDMYGFDSRYRPAYARLQRGRRPINQLKEREESLPSPRLDHPRNDSVTRARFKIEEGKHKVAIRFEPAVSGTHILLKLQTPFVGKNIDVQTVIASGYAGPRFFPVVQTR